MESNVPAAVVIGQDDGTEIHVQPHVQDGLRHVDIRIWRRGTSGFAPSRNALVVRADDLAPLQQGIAELLEASDGGRQAARIVWDDDDTRRLRAETEPFGTRYLASFAFWQRVRDSWKAADDGLVLAADRLEQLQDVLSRMRAWIEERPVEETEPAEEALQRQALYGWPSAGADWLTIAHGSIAFHPRGIRITCTVAEEGDRRSIVLRPWRRIDSLWVPETTELSLGIVDLDTLLFALARLIEDRAATNVSGEVTPDSEASLILTLEASANGEMLILEQRPAAEGGATQRLVLPFIHASRFGRMLVQAGSFLVARMSAEERDVLQSGDTGSPSVVAYESLPEAIRYEAAHGTAPSEDAESDPDEAASNDGSTWDHSGEDTGAPNGSDPYGGRGEPAAGRSETHIVSLLDVELGGQVVAFGMMMGESAVLSLTWNDRILALPGQGLADLAADLRTLYYDALRGRRGRSLRTTGEHPVTFDIQNEGRQMFCTLETEDGRTRLHFPANEVPVFLDATQAALAKLERGITA